MTKTRKMEKPATQLKTKNNGKSLLCLWRFSVSLKLIFSFRDPDI